MPDQTITDLNGKVRDFINSVSPRTKLILMENPAAWNRLCSSLDVIGDTELAFDAYEATDDDVQNGQIYILVYGVLQALVLQQDAVKHLAEVVGISYTPDSSLIEVREIRNDCSGHPMWRSTQKPEKQQKSSFISRPTMTKEGFQLITDYQNSTTQFKCVSLPLLISIQRTQLRQILQQVVKSLHAQEEEHRNMFRDQKLCDAFPPTTDYHFEKLVP